MACGRPEGAQATRIVHTKSDAHTTNSAQASQRDTRSRTPAETAQIHCKTSATYLRARSKLELTGEDPSGMLAARSPGAASNSPSVGPLSLVGSTLARKHHTKAT